MPLRKKKIHKNLSHLFLFLKTVTKQATDVGQMGRGRKKQNTPLYTCYSKLQPYDTNSQALSDSGCTIKHKAWIFL